MKFYRKGNMKATLKVDDTWEEFEDELVQTPIGERFKSEVETEEFKNLLREYELGQLRSRRAIECFSIVNQNFVINGKSATWFDTLTEEQKIEANEWVKAWRDVTETKVIPTKPTWLK